MSNSVQNINKVSNGFCPHGLTPGACPVCSGMGGGSRVGERPQKAGEMSYHQCAMIGAMMKARAMRMEQHEKNLQTHSEALKAFEQNLANLSAKLSEFALQISNSFVFKPIALIINKVVVPIINNIKNIPNIIKNIAEKFNNIREKFIDIQDKLNAIFGEAKVFIDKKVSEIVSSLKSKIKNIFKITKQNKTEDEENKINEDKKIFNLKKIIHKLLRGKKDDSDN